MVWKPIFRNPLPIIIFYICDLPVNCGGCVHLESAVQSLNPMGWSHIVTHNPCICHKTHCWTMWSLYFSLNCPYLSQDRPRGYFCSQKCKRILWNNIYSIATKEHSDSDNTDFKLPQKVWHYVSCYYFWNWELTNRSAVNLHLKVIFRKEFENGHTETAYKTEGFRQESHFPQLSERLALYYFCQPVFSPSGPTTGALLKQQCKIFWFLEFKTLQWRILLQ